MSKGRKKKSKTGTDKQKLAAVESPVAMVEAEQPVVNGAVYKNMNTTATTGTDEPEIQLHQHEDSNLNQPVAEASADAEALPLGEPPEVPVEARPVEPPWHDEPPAAEPVEAAAPQYATLGQRLRAAREARGWALEDVSSRLHIPLQIIQRLELEQFEKIGYGIYLRGYLNSYARLVDVPTILVDALVREHSDEPPLIASGTISHSRYLYQRYSVSALYLILTGVIIVPAVLLAMRAGLQPAVTQLAPIEAPANNAAADAGPASSAPATAATTSTGTSAAGAADAPASNAGQETALVASLAPFPALTHKEQAAAATTARVDTPAAAPAAAPASGMHTLKLTLKEASWVEVVAANGEKLEYGLLQGGSTRTYSSNKALEVRLGNCNGAQIETDGKLQDLTPFRRANIARFKLFADGEAISRSE